MYPSNCFNRHFNSIADDILKKRRFEGHKSFREYLLNSTEQSFDIYDCDNEEIINIISDLHANKGSGPNSINNTNIIQLLKEEISGPLCKICNL